VLSPQWDANFASSKMHGLVAQRENFDAVMKYVSKFRRAVDVGAHVGLWTAMMCEKFREVWAFEANDENFACLKKNMQKVHPHPAMIHTALGADNSRCDLALPDGGNSGCWHIVRGKSTGMTTLDAYRLGGVDLLKLDVEGWEGQVLMGAINTIRRSYPVVIFEDNGAGAKYYGADWIDPKVVLTAYGYKRAERIHKDEIWVRQ
jgi:FkbM family methyltransferase